MKTSSISKLSLGTVLVFGSALACGGETNKCAETCNTAPTARGTARIEGRIIQLSGSRSFDDQDDPLTYAWSIAEAPQGSTGAIADPTAKDTSIEATVNGLYRFRLVVNDGKLDSAPAQITAELINRQPIANAGSDLDRPTGGTTLSLDGSGSSDPDGDVLTYAWTLIESPAGSAAALSDATNVRPSITTDLDGTYTIELVVSDGKLTGADRVRVRIGDLGVPPVARAGVDLTGMINVEVSIDGSASSDADGDALTYAWRFTETPDANAVLAGSTTNRVRFTPAVVGRYVVELTVDDGAFTSSDQVAIEVTTMPIDPLQPGPSMFNPNEVYLFGTIEEGLADREAIAHWSTPNVESIGFNNASPPVIRRDGSVLYVILLVPELTEEVRMFRADPYERREEFPDQLFYPNEPYTNDPVIFTPSDGDCPGVLTMLVRPNGTVAAQCSSQVIDASGLIWDQGLSSKRVLSITNDNTMLYDDVFGYHVRTSTGVEYLVDIPGDMVPGIAVRLAPDDQSFFATMRIYDEPHTELWNIDFRGNATYVGTYSEELPGYESLFCSKLDPNLDLYCEGRDQSVVFTDVILRRSLTAPTELLYTEADDPKVKLHISYLMTGI